MRGLKNQYGRWITLAATLGLVDVAHALRMMSPASVIAQNARQGTKLCIAAGNGQYMAVEPADTRRVNANRRTCGPAGPFVWSRLRRISTRFSIRRVEPISRANQMAVSKVIEPI